VETTLFLAQDSGMQDSVPTLFDKHPKETAGITGDSKKSLSMGSLPRARITAPVVHVSLFVLASVLMWVSDKPILDGPAKVPFGILFFGDLPISAFAFSVMFTSEKNGWTAWVLWGIAGTIWWYFLGVSIEAWMRRLAAPKH
jgi:hypothetical protein